MESSKVPVLRLELLEDGTIELCPTPACPDDEALVRRLIAVPHAAPIYEAAGMQTLYNAHSLAVRRGREGRSQDERFDDAAAAVAATALLLLRYAKLPESSGDGLRAALRALARSAARGTN